MPTRSRYRRATAAAHSLAPRSDAPDPADGGIDGTVASFDGVSVAATTSLRTSGRPSS